MKVHNLSGKQIPRRLWHHLASKMGLGKHLPLATHDDLGLYPAHGTLDVKIRPVLKHPQETPVTSGYYSCGRIVILPCPSCTGAFLTHLFLHELFHAWIDQYHNELYDSQTCCDVAERFADACFQALGGRIRPLGLCGSYRFSRNTEVMMSDSALSPLLQSLHACTSQNVLDWRADSAPNTALQRIGPSSSDIVRLVVRPGRPLNFGR